jgi:hypothetical protein
MFTLIVAAFVSGQFAVETGPAPSGYTVEIAADRPPAPSPQLNIDLLARGAAEAKARSLEAELRELRAIATRAEQALRRLEASERERDHRERLARQEASVGVAVASVRRLARREPIPTSPVIYRVPVPTAVRHYSYPVQQREYTYNIPASPVYSGLQTPYYGGPAGVVCGPSGCSVSAPSGMRGIFGMPR